MKKKKSNPINCDPLLEKDIALLEEVKDTREPYLACSRIAERVKMLMHQKQEAAVESCLKRLKAVYKHGSSIVRIAIENVFLYSMGTHISGHCDRNSLWCQMPGSFRRKMLGQMTSSGI